MTRTTSVLLTILVAFLPMTAFGQSKEAPEMMQGNVKIGDKVPDFTLKDQDGREHSLKNLLDADGYLALVFYRSADW